MHLVWRTFFSKLFRDVARKTEEFRKMTVNESSICEREFGMKRETVPDWLKLLLQLLGRRICFFFLSRLNFICTLKVLEGKI
jgi:hypothetical protein